MKQQIDYITLMHEMSEVGTTPTRFSVHHDGDRPKLLDDERFSFLYVLQGELKLVFKGSYTRKLTAQHMIVADKSQLRELHCVGDTVIFECVESDKMSPLMQTTSRAFSMPCSEIITLNSRLKTWCRDMFTDLADNPIRNNDYYHSRCSELTAMLLEYPHDVLGTLYVPLYACSQRCETCSRLFVRNESVIE